MKNKIIYMFLTILLLLITVGCGQAPSDPIVETTPGIIHPNLDPDDEAQTKEEDIATEFGGRPFATGVEKDGYKEYLLTRTVGETENWIDFTHIDATDIIKYTILLPSEYDFVGATVFSVAGQKVGELSFVVKLKEGQEMPVTLEGFGIQLGLYDYGNWWADYYNGELLSTAEGHVFLARQIVEPYGGDGSIKVWYPHTFYTEKGGYVIAINFYPLVEYPEEEVIEEYLKIVTSIEIV